MPRCWILLRAVPLIGLLGFSAVGLCGDNVWTGSGNLGSGRVNALAVDPHDPWTVYAATLTGIYKTSDGGATWRRLDGPGTPAGQTQAVAAAPNSTVYAGSCGGSAYLIRTSDGGSTWTSATADLVNTCIQSLAIDPSNPSTIYAGTNIVGAPTGSSTSGVFRSSDGGGSWQRRNSGMGNQTVLALAIDPANPSTVYAGTFSGGVVYKSTNRGDDWSVRSTGLGTASVGALAVEPGSSSNVYAGLEYSAGIYRSTDAAASWASITPSPVTSGAGSALVLDPSLPSIIYAGFAQPFWGGTYRSADGGTTWTTFNNGLTDLNVTAVAIDRSGTFLYASTGNLLDPSHQVFSLRIVQPRLRVLPPFRTREVRTVSPRP